MKIIYTFCIALLILISFAGCKEDCTECCDNTTVDYKKEPSNAANNYDFISFAGTLTEGDHIYYYYLPGTPSKVQFFIGKSSDDICTDEHLSIFYEVGTEDIVFDRTVKIYGEIYWSIFSDEVVLMNNTPPQNTDIGGNLTDVGFKQAFPEGAAEADVYVNVEFESLGTFSQDSAYFRSHFNYMRFNYTYNKF